MTGMTPSYQADVRKGEPGVLTTTTAGQVPSVVSTQLPEFPPGLNRPVPLEFGALPHAAAPVDTFTPPTAPVALTLPKRAEAKTALLAQVQAPMDRLRASTMPDLVALFEAMRKQQLSA